MIVPDDMVKTRLNTQGISAKITQVVAVEIEDDAECLHRVVSSLADEEIDIVYAYTVSFDSKERLSSKYPMRIWRAQSADLKPTV